MIELLDVVTRYADLLDPPPAGPDQLLAALESFLGKASQTRKWHQLDEHEKALEELLSRAFERQRRELLARLPLELKEAAGDQAMDSTFELTWDDFTGPITQELGSAIDLGSAEVADQFGWFNTKHPAAYSYLAARAAELVTQINESTRADLRHIITKGGQEGWSYDRVAAEITRKYNQFSVPQPQRHIRSRAHLVAVNEIGKAYEAGGRMQVDRMSALGLRMVKEWMTVSDSRVDPQCDSYQKMGWIKHDETWDGIEFPPAHPACRCTVQYERAKDQCKAKFVGMAEASNFVALEEAIKSDYFADNLDNTDWKTPNDAAKEVGKYYSQITNLMKSGKAQTKIGSVTGFEYVWLPDVQDYYANKPSKSNAPGSTTATVAPLPGYTDVVDLSVYINLTVPGAQLTPVTSSDIAIDGMINNKFDHKTVNGLELFSIAGATAYYTSKFAANVQAANQPPSGYLKASEVATLLQPELDQYNYTFDSIDVVNDAFNGAFAMWDSPSGEVYYDSQGARSYYTAKAQAHFQTQQQNQTSGASLNQYNGLSLVNSAPMGWKDLSYVSWKVSKVPSTVESDAIAGKFEAVYVVAVLGGAPLLYINSDSAAIYYSNLNASGASQPTSGPAPIVPSPANVPLMMSPYQAAKKLGMTYSGVSYQIKKGKLHVTNGMVDWADVIKVWPAKAAAANLVPAGAGATHVIPLPPLAPQVPAVPTGTMMSGTQLAALNKWPGFEKSHALELITSGLGVKNADGKWEFDTGLVDHWWNNQGPGAPLITSPVVGGLTAAGQACLVSGAVYKRYRDNEAATWTNHYWANQSLRADEKSSLRSYQGAQYAYINGALRGRAGMSGAYAAYGAQSHIANIDKAMNRYAIPENVVLIRGCGPSTFGLGRLPGSAGEAAGLLVGKVFEDTGYMSTSIGATPPGIGYSKPIWLRIATPAGTPALNLDKMMNIGEREVLLHRGRKFVVTGVKDKAQGGGGYEVEVTIVP